MKWNNEYIKANYLTKTYSQMAEELGVNKSALKSRLKTMRDLGMIGRKYATYNKWEGEHIETLLRVSQSGIDVSRQVEIISEQTGHPTGSVSQMRGALRKQGYDIKKQRRKRMIGGKEGDLAEMWKEGVATEVIAQRFGIRREQVYYYTRGLDHKRREHSKYESIEADVCRDYADNVPLLDMVKKWQLTRATIHWIAQKNGVRRTPDECALA